MTITAKIVADSISPERLIIGRVDWDDLKRDALNLLQARAEAMSIDKGGHNEWPSKVNHPQHYGGNTAYETIKVLEEWLTVEQFIGFLRGNAIKYQSRAGKKQGTEAEEDLRKAEWYTQYEIRFRERASKPRENPVSNSIGRRLV